MHLPVQGVALRLGLRRPPAQRPQALGPPPGGLAARRAVERGGRGDVGRATRAPGQLARAGAEQRGDAGVGPRSRGPGCARAPCRCSRRRASGRRPAACPLPPARAGPGAPRAGRAGAPTPARRAGRPRRRRPPEVAVHEPADQHGLELPPRLGRRRRATAVVHLTRDDPAHPRAAHRRPGAPIRPDAAPAGRPARLRAPCRPGRGGRAVPGRCPAARDATRRPPQIPRRFYCP